MSASAWLGTRQSLLCAPSSAQLVFVQQCFPSPTLSNVTFKVLATLCQQAHTGRQKRTSAQLQLATTAQAPLEGAVQWDVTPTYATKQYQLLNWSNQQVNTAPSSPKTHRGWSHRDARLDWPPRSSMPWPSNVRNPYISHMPMCSGPQQRGRASQQQRTESCLRRSKAVPDSPSNLAGSQTYRHR